MRMYVANATKQLVDFMYRVPEMPGVRVQCIPIAGQILITDSEKFNSIQVDSIIDQHRKYGMLSVDEIDRSKSFTGLCYSIDKMIPVGKIMQAVNHNTEMLQERGRQIRKEAAIAENNRIEQNMLENDVPGVLNKLEVSVVEENHDERDTQPALAEGIRITRNEPESAKPSTRPSQYRRGNRR